jgi:hypothetical protein
MSLPRLRGEDLRCLELSWLELMASRSESPTSTHTYIHDDIMRPGVGTVENSEHHRSYIPYDEVSPSIAGVQFSHYLTREQCDAASFEFDGIPGLALI